MRSTLCALFLLGSVPLAAARPQDPPKKDAPAPARDKPLPSTDDAMRFGQAAWGRVAPAAEKLFKEKGTDFVVEAVTTPPKADADKLAALKPAAREQFFREYAEARAKELKLKGVYVVVSKKPATLYVHVSEAAGLPKDFGPKLKAALIASFNDDKFDEGLTKAVDMTLAAKGVGEKK